MRTFEDTTGRHWDVAISEASYGTQQLIFAVRAGRELRVHILSVDSRFAAEQLLLTFSDAELRRFLTDAPEWQPG